MPDLTYTCPNPECKMLLLNPIETRHGRGQQPSLNDIMVCGGCNLASIVEPLGLRLCTESEYVDFPVEVRREMILALQALENRLRSS